MGFCPGRLIWRHSVLLSRSVSRPRGMSTTVTSDKIPITASSAAAACSSSSSSSSPWLMLPPKLNNDKNDMISFSFYSLSENRVLTPPPRPHNIINEGLTKLMLPNPIHDLRFCGSSHGWLALFNPHSSLDLFLYNPISHRHIKLPPIPNFQGHKKVSVTKLILSSSPDDDDESSSSSCRAVMMYDCESGLAFCCPGRSKEWTLVDTQRYTWEDGVNKGGELVGTIYDDIAYSSRQNLFFALFRPNNELDTWDLTDPSSPRMIKTIKSRHYYDYSSDDDDDELEVDDPYTKDGLPGRSKYLVVAPNRDDDNKDDVLLVIRSVMRHVTPDGSYLEYYNFSSNPVDLYPHMTMNFFIAVYDQQHIDDHDHLRPLADMGGLALFVGSHSDSVALSATRFPELKPNSVYFTDPHETRFDPSSEELYGGHDIGIFDYETRTVSPCYYPCDLPSLKRNFPSPMWFFPSF